MEVVAHITYDIAASTSDLGMLLGHLLQRIDGAGAVPSSTSAGQAVTVTTAYDADTAADPVPVGRLCAISQSFYAAGLGLPPLTDVRRVDPRVRGRRNRRRDG